MSPGGPRATGELVSAGAVPESPWFEVGSDRVRLLRDGRQAFPAMLEAIRAAEREILLEMYWVGPDVVGDAFRSALAARARAGVRVCVIYDSMGSLDLNREWWRELSAAGGTVAEFHSISPLDDHFRIDRLERRDHRKLLVVDGAQGFTGGINLTALWLPYENGGAGWRDDMVQVRGFAAEELRTLFFKTWRKVTGEPVPLDVRPLARRRTRPVWVLASQWRTLRSIHREYVFRIGSAARQVDIANSYFVPDRSVRRALFRAIRRGAKVRVLVPARSDVQVVQYASEALFDTLLRHGVEIYALPQTMLHAKTAIVDDRFTTIGSYNLDERSWRKNLEVNLAVEDEGFARHTREWFEHDIARAERIDLRDWRQRSLARRGFEWAAYALRKLW